MEWTKDKLEKIANLALQQVAAKSIALVCGVSESDLATIQATTEYQKVVARKTEGQIEEAGLMDNSWDAVEKLALTNLLVQLRMNQDPDLALKAGHIANRAMRRHTVHNKPLQAVEAGARVFVSLNQTFVQALQTRGLSATPSTMLEAKTVSVLSPLDVENAIGGHKTNAERLLEMVPTMAEAD